MPSVVLRGADEVRAELRKESEEIVRRIAEAAAEGLYDAIQKYYLGRSSSGGFWRRIASAFKLERPENGVARLAMDGPEAAILLHKIEGGEIRARNAEALAIPLTKEARKYASPRDVPNPLVLVRTKRGNGILAEVEKRHGSRGGRIKPWYVLRRSVWHGPDPDAVPSDEFVLREVSSRIAAVMDAPG